MSLASSLIDLKAELSKKREESKSNRSFQVNLKGGYKWKLLAEKLETKNKVKQLKAKKEKTTNEDEKRAIDEEIEKELQASKRALERKTAIYEAKMNKAMEGVFQDSDDEPEDEDQRCLVNFDGKAMEQIKIRNEERRKAEERLRGYKRKDEEENDDGDWVEFTDSLGRTRRCLREDLKYFVDANRNLGHAESNEAKKFKYLDNSSDKEESKPETKEEGPIHYADVRFNEAREHGVGFYQLSGDSEERRKQMEQLDQLHEQLLKEKELKTKEKEKKSNAMEERLARIAARRGLPFKAKSSKKDETSSTEESD